ncbi:hypothetical protein M422DRAFT_246256 [Sphaerobolus stellatus SS14]|nr:hypothetical protein M422DRAFT_246256 [Sphaerobolus stellatus SS14]
MGKGNWIQRLADFSFLVKIPPGFGTATARAGGKHSQTNPQPNNLRSFPRPSDYYLSEISKEISFNLADIIIGPHSSELVASADNANSITELAEERKKKFLKKNLENHYFEAVTLLAPIRRLPDEILERILLFALTEVFEWNGNYYYKIGPGKGDVEVEIRSLYEDRLDFLLICHRWKRVLYQCPAAWIAIFISPWVSVFTVEHSLHLSKARKLDVCLFGRCKLKSSDAVDQTDEVTRTMDLLLPYLPNIEPCTHARSHRVWNG